MDGLYWKTLLNWMIWGYPYFWKHPNGAIRYNPYKRPQINGFHWSYFTPKFSWSYGHLLLTGRDSQLWKIRLKITIFGASLLSNWGLLRNHNDTVDGRNLAPVDRYFIPWFAGFHTFLVVQDFSHQQYYLFGYMKWKVTKMKSLILINQIVLHLKTRRTLVIQKNT